jgi:hypothetical protein
MDTKIGDVFNRLLKESADLCDKIAKLDTFIGSDKYYKLSTEERGLMQLQLRLMQDYEYTLNRRIDYFKRNKCKCED